MQLTTGLIKSSTVTTAVPVETLPFTSVTVKVTVLFPTSAQLNIVELTVTLAIPTLSDDPLLT